MWGRIGRLQQEDAERIVGGAIDAGINFIDTADVYAGGRSEEITGQALENLKVARESSSSRPRCSARRTGREHAGASRSHIVAALKESLRRLQLDHVDLYQIHGFDPATPIEETVRALDTMVEHGHVRHVGVSNWPAWQIMKALGISERLGLARFESLQAYYSIAGRDLERELVPMLRSEGLGLIVWSPLAGGLLCGKYGRDRQGEAGSRRTAFDFPPVDKERAYACVDAMRDIAAARGVSVAQIALAWLLHQPAVTSVIIGAKKPEQLADNLAAVAVELGADELDRLGDVEQSFPPSTPDGCSLVRARGERSNSPGRDDPARADVGPLLRLQRDHLAAVALQEEHAADGAHLVARHSPAAQARAQAFVVGAPVAGAVEAAARVDEEVAVRLPLEAPARAVGERTR